MNIISHIHLAPLDPPGSSKGLPGCPEADFFNRHIRDNEKLSPQMRCFMLRLLLDSEELPWRRISWAAEEEPQCVFEDSKGEVQVCFGNRHLHLSPEREDFITSRISDQPFSAEHKEILLEWVRTSSSTNWKKPGVRFEVIDGSSGVYEIVLIERTLNLVNGDTEWKEKPCRFTFASGFVRASNKDLLERALASGADAALIEFPDEDRRSQSQEWIDALRKRFRVAEIEVMVASAQTDTNDTQNSAINFHIKDRGMSCGSGCESEKQK